MYFRSDLKIPWGASVGIRKSLVIFLLGAAFLLFGGISPNDTESEKYSTELSAYASEESYEGGVLEELWELMPDGAPKGEEELGEAVGIGGIGEALLQAMSQGAASGGRFILSLFGIALILSAAEVFCRGGEELSQSVKIGVNVVVAIPVFSVLYSVMEQVTESLNAAAELMGGLIPLMSGVLSASGLISLSGTQATGMTVTLGIVQAVSSVWLMPIVSTSFVLAIGVSAGSDNAERTLGFFKRIFAVSSGVLVTVIVGSMSVQSMISVSADGITMKGIKYAVSNMVPVVGGVVSGSLSALMGSMGYLSSVIGAASSVAVIGIFALPVIQLLYYRLALTLSSFIVEGFGANTGKRMIGAFLASLDSMLLTLGACGIAFIFEIGIFMRHGVGAL
jgi:stage III sporulation protein AE